MSLLYLLLLIVVAAAVGVSAYFLSRYFGRKQLTDSLDVSLFLIKIPRVNPSSGSNGTASKDFKDEITHFEQLLGGLSALKRPFVFEVAVPHVGEEIHFYIGVSKFSTEIAKKQVQGMWNGASVELVQDDFNIFNSNGATAAAYIAQKENFALPIRSYAELGIDSFESIIGSFAKINEIGEGAALQLIVKPAYKDAPKTIQHYIELLKKGEPLHRAFSGGMPTNLSEAGEFFSPKTEKETEKAKQEKVVDEEAVKALQLKVTKPLFEVNVRLVASAGSQFQAKDILDGLTAGFSQFESPNRNGFRVIVPKNPKGLIEHFIYRTFDTKYRMILSSEEIASIYHLPTSSTEAPRIKWLKSREAAPPENLPKEGALLGWSNFRGESRPIYITAEDRRRHIYVLGQTGTGKTTEIASMLIDDIKAGRGVAIIDPHGEFAEKALAQIPRERIDDVIYFDPGDLSRPMGINMLDYNINRPEEKTFIVNEMQSIFNKLFSEESMGPMFEQYMRNALLLLMEDMPNEPATLIEVPRIFTDAAFRNRKLERIHNPVVIDFWQKEATKAGGEASLANMTPYITSKFSNFISNDYMRPIIGQPKSAFNFREVMDDGKILLINLSKGRIGDLNASLLGMIFTGKILMAALSRVDIPEEANRRDFYLYIDEFQNFATDSISTILSEARKYHLSLTMAHQFIAQLKEEIRDAVFGNVGTELIMRVGPQDAEFLVKQFEPVFGQNDLIGIDNLNAFVKLLVNGQTSRPFNMKMNTSSWAPGNQELAVKLKEYSRMKYGEDRQVIEEAIFARLRA